MDRAEGGLGLGLALVKNLVALHGGTVSAKNRAAGGSEFSVTIPRLNAAATDEPREVRGAERRIRATSAHRRVLASRRRDPSPRRSPRSTNSMMSGTPSSR